MLFLSIRVVVDFFVVVVVFVVIMYGMKHTERLVRIFSAQYTNQKSRTRIHERA